MNDWKKKHEKMVPQHNQKLPPTWVSQEKNTTMPHELGHTVHISGRNRCVAKRLVELLREAEEQAVVSSFLLADQEIEDALLETSQRGVRVYVMISSEARLGRETGDGEFEQRVLAGHTEMLNRLAGHVLFRSASHFHAKMLLVDPWSNPQGLLLTANLTREALERNEELAVELEGKDVKDAAALMGWAMWETAEHELVDQMDRFRSVKPVGSLAHPTPSMNVVATTAECSELRHRAIEIIESAKRQLVVSSFGWDMEHAVVQRICQRARDGLNVTVLARVRPSAMPALISLREAGAQVLGFKWLHAKAIWSDDGRALVMSANLQANGLDQGFELGLHLGGERFEELGERLRAWFGLAQWQLEEAPRLSDVQGRAMIWQDNQLTEVNVLEQSTVFLGEYTASSAEELVVDEPSIPSGEIAHEVCYTWVVNAPTLQPKAKEIFQPGDEPHVSYSPRAFEERLPRGKRLVIAVNTPEELDAAKQLRDELSAAAVVVRKETQP